MEQIQISLISIDVVLSFFFTFLNLEIKFNLSFLQTVCEISSWKILKTATYQELFLKKNISSTEL